MTLLHAAAVTTCEAGDPDGERTVVLVGDSHAAHWLPALDQLGVENGWRVVLAARQSCTWFSGHRPYVDRTAEDLACEDWNTAIQEYILNLKPTLVVHGALANGYPETLDVDREAYDAAIAQGYTDAWGEVLDAGISVVAIRELPQLPMSGVRCLIAFGATPEGCSYPLSALTAGPSWITMATELESRATLFDPVPGVCPDAICQSVIGNVHTYRDDNHLTDPYARSLSWMLDDQLRAVHPDLFGRP